MITITKKHMLYIYTILLFCSKLLFGEDNFTLRFKDKNYIVFTTFPLIFDFENSERIPYTKTKEIKEKFFYYCLYEDEQIRDLNNKKMIIKIKDNNNQILSFDLGSIMYDKSMSDCRVPRLAFFSDSNGVDILYYDSLFSDSHRCKIISFDFNTNYAKITFETQISDLFCSLFQNSKSYSFEEEIYMRIYKHKDLIENEYSCYTGDEPLCGGWADFIYTTVSDNRFIQDPYNEKSIEKDFFLKRLTNSRPKKMLTDKDFLYGKKEKLLLKNVVYKTKSFLIEGTTEYKPSNMQNFSNIPYVPNIQYDKEEIIIEADNEIAGLFICNGFYHQDKPNLYTENSRPKEIEIIYDDSYQLHHCVILEDIQKSQFVPLLNINENKIRIKILSVYEGTKYKDTCINCIKPVGKFSEFDFYESQK